MAKSWKISASKLSKKTRLAFILLAVALTSIFLNFFYFYNSSNTKGEKEKEKKQNLERLLHTKLHDRDKAYKKLQELSYNNEKERKRKFPSVVGIGVRKCGTDGLIRFIGKHPLIKIPLNIDTEASFFNERFANGMQWYRMTTNHTIILNRGKFGRGLFPLLNENEITMEKTPNYFDGLPHNLPERIRENLLDVKLLLIVCDPVSRTFSDYIHLRTLVQLSGSKLFAKYETFEDYLHEYLPIAKRVLEKSLSQEEIDSDVQKKLTNLSFSANPHRAIQILFTGLYYYHIQRWFRVFNQSNLMIIDGEEFLTNPGKIIEDVQDFIGIQKLVLKEDFVINNQTGFFCYKRMEEKDFNSNLKSDELHCLGKYKGRTRRGKISPPSAESFANLTEFYKPFNEKFYKIIGRNFSWRLS